MTILLSRLTLISTRNYWRSDSTEGILRLTCVNCAYHADFEKEKLLWIELVTDGRFAYDNSGLYGEATTFLLTGEAIKYLCALLNTRLIRWFLGKSAPTSGMGTLRWKKVYVERLPIPRVSTLRQQPFVECVNQILLEAGEGRALAVETEIEEMTYQLYGLSPSEIAEIETCMDGNLTKFAGP